MYVLFALIICILVYAIIMHIIVCMHVWFVCGCGCVRAWVCSCVCMCVLVNLSVCVSVCVGACVVHMCGVDACVCK